MKHLLLLLCLCSSTLLYAQSGSVSGQINDQSTGEPLIGATVRIPGTNKGTITDIDGKFTLGNLEHGDIKLTLSFVGYTDQILSAKVSGGNVNLGTINLETSSVGLNEVMIIASVAIDRKTPVAVSTIKALEIESKMGSHEFPEILKSTPGVFATRAGGGSGDGRVSIRGFASENVAVLINGIPVNDMENGRIFWSNWAGLTDATSSMQVQRGLGASKVAVPSIGGTINIISKASDKKQGGSAYVATGNDAYSKIGFQISTGLNDNGWAVTLSGAKTQGDGYVDGTERLEFSYFANIAKIINDKHELALTVVGAKQRHGQRQNRQTLATFEAAPSGIKYNGDWGVRNGKVVNVEDNFYHKPQTSLNWYWTIGEDTELSTAAYASWGSGGGGGTGGNWNTGPNNEVVRTGGPFGAIDVDRLVQINEANPSGESLAWQRASRNDHSWYGVLSTLNHKLTSNLTLMAGLDVRSYVGKHFYEVTDLLGGEYIINNDDSNNPNRSIVVGDRYNYNYDGQVGWQGLFGQLEYSQGKLDAFANLAVSNTSYQQLEKFNNTPENRESEEITFIGYQIKGGANYNLTDNHNVYANVGYFTKAPFYRNVFLSRRSNNTNSAAENEKILSAEVGYGFRSSNLTLNVNLYRTEWRDRSLIRSFTQNDILFFANITGVNAVHQGVEFDAVYELTRNLKITGMLSIGDYRWANNVENVRIENEDGDAIGNPINVFSDGLKVGDAAQTTAALGISYILLRGLIFGANFNHFSNLYASFDPVSRNEPTDARVESWKVPATNLLDLNVTYNFDISDMASSIYANVYNVGDVEYVADANDGRNNDAASASVYYAAGLTWNIGLKVRF